MLELKHGNLNLKLRLNDLKQNVGFQFWWNQVFRIDQTEYLGKGFIFSSIKKNNNQTPPQNLLFSLPTLLS